MHHDADNFAEEGGVGALEVGGDDAGVQGEGGDSSGVMMVVDGAGLDDEGDFGVCVAFPVGRGGF